MAKLSMIQRELKRRDLVRRFADKRRALKDKVNDPTLDAAQRRAAQRILQALPRDASPVRLRNRCRVSGRPRGYYRRFGLGRNKLREAAMRGEIPGLVKASW
jgi:small subunit ribosomal protein S14